MSTNQSPQRTPLGEQLMKEPGVLAWFQSVKPTADKLAAVPDDLNRLWQAHRKKAMEIEVNGHLSKAGKIEQLAALVNETLRAVDVLFVEADKNLKFLVARIDGVMQPVPLGAQEALLQESQIARAWQRMKGVLDTITEQHRVLQRIDAFAAEAAREPGGAGKPTLKALREELPSYLMARRFNIADQAMDILTRHEAQFLTPVQRAATQLANVCGGGWGRLTASFQIVRSAITNNSSTPNLTLPGLYIPERMKF